jgi:hypothetical protein
MTINVLNSSIKIARCFQRHRNPDLDTEVKVDFLYKFIINQQISAIHRFETKY